MNEPLLTTVPVVPIPERSQPLPPRLLEDIIALANDAIITVDREHRIAQFNRGAEEIFGYTAEEVLGKPISMLVPLPQRDGHTDQVDHFGRGLVDSRRMGARREVAGLRKNGEVFPAEVSISKHEIDGRRFYTSILRDISARKRQEAQLRLLQTMALEIAAADDVESARQRALQEVGQVTGWATGEAWIPNRKKNRLERGAIWTGGTMGMEAFHVMSEDFTFAPGEGLVGRAWLSGEPLWVDDLQSSDDFVRKEVARTLGLRTAMVIPVLAREEVVAVLAFYHFHERREDQQLLGLVSTVAAQIGTFVERKQAEAALAAQARALSEQAAELERSNAELEQFAYVASHDLQEPLRMVASYTQLLERHYGTALDDDAREYIGYAVDGVKRMRELIMDLLAYSRVGSRSGAFETTDAGRVLEQTIADLAAAIEESGAVVTHDPLPTVTADAGQLGQLLQNLLGNALKFHRDGVTPRVHIGARREGTFWVFSVNDNGIGIEPEYHERIFSIFQRLHGRGEYAGTGIGLAICKKIVERHGGRLWLDSTPGEGTTFHFSFPVGGPQEPIGVPLVATRSG
jgi:PAS domain S-box-containing protein